MRVGGGGEVVVLVWFAAIGEGQLGLTIDEAAVSVAIEGAEAYCELIPQCQAVRL